MKKLFVIALCVLLSGCASDLKVSTVPVERVPLNIVQQPPLTLQKVHFNIQVDAQGNVTYVLSGKDFDNLATNMEQVQKYLNTQGQQLNACILYNK